MSTTMNRPAPKLTPPAITEAVPRPVPLPDNGRVTRRKSTDEVRPVDTASIVDVRDLTIPGGPVGEIWLRVFRPAGASEPLPVVMYILGDRLVFGNARTRRLASKLATKLQASVVVVDYSLSPKARYPVAIEETYTAAVWIAEHGTERGLDGTHIAVTADSTGRDLADELMLMADDRGGPALAAHALLSPQTTAVLRAALAA